MSISVSMGGKEEVKSEPNVVPLCDVLLVLLIIFMVVTPLVQEGVDVKLPSALNVADMPDSPEVVLAVKRDGTIYVNEQKVAMESLQNALEEAFLTVSDKKLYIRADEDIEYGKIIDLIDVMREAGIEIVGIITEKKAQKAL